MTAIAPPRDLARRSGTSTSAKVVALVLQTAHLAVVARVLTETSFGAFAAGMALLAILGALAEFGLIHTSVLALADGGDEGAVVAAAVRASTWLVGAALLVAGGASVLLLDADARWCVLVLVPWFVISRLDSAFVAVHQFHLRTDRLATIDVVSRAALVLATVPLVVWDGPASTRGQLVAVAAGLALSEAISFGLLVRGVRVRWAGARPRSIDVIRDAAPLGLTNATSLVHARSDQVVLEAMGHRTGLAAYAIAFRVNEAMLALAGAAGAVTFTALARSEGAERVDQARRFIRLSCVLAVAAAGAIFIAAPLIATVLGGDRYPESAHLIRLLVPALAVSMVNLPIAQLAIAHGAARRLLALVGAAVVANVLLTIALVAAVGVPGAAVATSLTEAAGLLAGAALAHRMVPGSVPWRSVLAVPVLATVPLWAGLVLWRHGLPGLLP